MRRPLLVLCALAVIGVIVIIVWPRRQIPQYRGRPVTDWIRDANSASATQQQEDKAAEAVRAGGTNALGYWMELLSATNEPPFVDFWNSTIGQKATFHRQTIDEKWGYAFCALYFLGPDAKPAIPELTKLLDCRVMTPNEWATIILLGLGPEGVRAVTNALANTNCSMRSVIAGTVGGWNGKPPYYTATFVTNRVWEWPPPVMNAVVPALERCLDDPDISSRVFAADSLGRLHKDAENIVPAIARNLSKATNTTECLITLQALCYLGTDAKSARAQVASFLNNTNSDVRTVASNALRAIDSGKPQQ